MPRILLATIGSYGDVNPFLALGRELKSRGHSIILAAPRQFEDDIAREGLEFAPLRPHVQDGDPAFMKKVMDARRGSEFILRELLMPEVAGMYEDLVKAAQGADLMVSHMITYALPPLAETEKIPWVNVVLQPMMFFSPFDPPILAPAPWLSSGLRRLGPGFNKYFLRLLTSISYSWSDPVRDLRKKLGLSPGKDPIFAGQHSPYGVLAMFSGVFGPPQPDWPAKVRVCGFPFFDEDFGGKGIDRQLEDFLSAGEPPLVFTLGSSAVKVAGNFYAYAAAAAKRLSRRAVFLAGPKLDSLGTLPKNVLAVKSAPYHLLFPRASVIIHSGGIGTTAQALRSGRPQLVVPFAHDQFDNADRVKRLGAGDWVYLNRLDARKLEETLRRVACDTAIAAGARSAAKTISAERGVLAACDEIENVLKK